MTSIRMGLLSAVCVSVLLLSSPVAAQPTQARGRKCPADKVMVGGRDVLEVLTMLGAKRCAGVTDKELADYVAKFNRSDADRDGKHSKKEYIEDGNFMTPQARRGIFGAADNNGDGFVTRAEYVLNRILTDEAKAIVRRADVDKDGKTVKAEFVSHSPLKDKVLAAAVFDALDTNGDGTIPIPEYLRVWGGWARPNYKAQEIVVAGLLEKLGKAGPPSGDVVALSVADVLKAAGDGPDGKGNTADDTWQFWFELAHKKNTFHRLDIHTAKMTPPQRAKGIKGKVTGPIAAQLPNPKDTEGWIFHSDWDGRFEGVWGDRKTGKVLLHPYVEKQAHRAVAVSWRAPKVGVYTISGKLVDQKSTKHKLHDGIYWKVMVSTDGSAGRMLGRGGPFGDGRGPASVDLKFEKADLKAGEMVFLIVHPGKWWGADLTVVDSLRIERVSD
jgi:hypothetical protein